MTTATTPHDTPTASATSEIVVRCSGLTKIFRDFWMRNRVCAVDGIQLEICRGEVFGLLGPNGSGKSTTVKLILGLLHRTSGRITVFGKRAEDVATKKMIGYLPEESYLYRFLNARETLDYYGRLFHQSRKQRRNRIDMLLEMVGLEAVQRRPVGEYSKGMQRRIGLAQALINDPQLLILDEPTTGLDPIGTHQIKDLILELKRRGKTVLLCSHLLADVEDVCDRVAIMYGGKIRSEGTVDELLVRQGMTTIHTPELDAKTIQEIEELLHRRGKAIERVEQPRQKLEAHFLDIVHGALADGLKTSGAQVGGLLAEFLIDETRAAHMPKDVEAAALIDRLVADNSPVDAPPTELASSAQSKPQQSVEEEADSTVVDDLLASGTSAPTDGSEPGSEVSEEPTGERQDSGTVQPTQQAIDGGNEKRDQSFIDALTNAEPFEQESKDTQGGGTSATSSGTRDQTRSP